MSALLSHAEVAEDRTGPRPARPPHCPWYSPRALPTRGEQKVVAMRWEAFLDQVQERGEYGTRQEAERAGPTVLALLGAHLVGEVRAALAARLPDTFG